MTERGTVGAADGIVVLELSLDEGNEVRHVLACLRAGAAAWAATPALGAVDAATRPKDVQHVFDVADEFELEAVRVHEARQAHYRRVAREAEKEARRGARAPELTVHEVARMLARFAGEEERMLTSAEFCAAVTMLAALLPPWVRGLAADAEGHDSARAAMAIELARARWPAPDARIVTHTERRQLGLLEVGDRYRYETNEAWLTVGPGDARLIAEGSYGPPEREVEVWVP